MAPYHQTTTGGASVVRLTETPRQTLYIDQSGHKISLKLVEVIAEGRHCDLQVFALTDLEDQLLHLAASLHGITWQVLPVVEDALRECLATGLLTQCGHEAERLRDGEMRLHLDERSALTRILLEDATAAQVHARVDAAHGLLRACDLDQENWLLKCRLCRHLCGEA